MPSLFRFLDAQANFYRDARIELINGRKASHWMWFVFPQVVGLGSSEKSKKYAICDLNEAKDYLAHPILGNRLRECIELLLAHQGRSINDIMEFPDDLKLQSSLTLFEFASEKREDRDMFDAAISIFFDGNRDRHTTDFLNGYSSKVSLTKSC